MDDTKLTVEFNGNNVEINVIDVIDNLDDNKKYIVYYVEGYDDDFFISLLEETDTTYVLKEITDENELRMVEDYLEKMMEEEEKEGV